MLAYCITILWSDRLLNVTNNDLEKLGAAKKSFKIVQSKTSATKRRTPVLFRPHSLICSSLARMPSLSPSDTAFIVSQHYGGKSAVQIQRKFRRDRKQKVAFSTVSRWFNRVGVDQRPPERERSESLREIEKKSPQYEVLANEGGERGQKDRH